MNYYGPPAFLPGDTLLVSIGLFVATDKGIAQSYGVMVNYLYDLNKIEAHHEKFTEGEVAHSRAVATLL